MLRLLELSSEEAEFFIVISFDLRWQAHDTSLFRFLIQAFAFTHQLFEIASNSEIRAINFSRCRLKIADTAACW